MGTFNGCVLLLTQLALAVALPIHTKAQQCDMSRKSISYRVTMCDPRGCKLGQERIDVVGEKAIHYDSALERLGTVYYLGKTVDFCNPQLETYSPALCRNQFGPVRAQGTASFVGGNLKLTLVQSIPETQTQFGGKTTQFMQILVQACSSCSVQEISIDGIRTDGQPVYSSRMASSEFCQILDTSTVTH